MPISLFGLTRKCIMLSVVPNISIEHKKQSPSNIFGFYYLKLNRGP